VSITNSLAILILGAALIRESQAVADDRIWLDRAEINKQPMKLVLDSGSTHNFLTPEALKRLGLKFIPDATNDLAPAGIWAGDTELCSISFNGIQDQTTFLVFDLRNADMDGGMAWYSLSQTTLKIDATSQRVLFLPEVPRKSFRWCQLPVYTNSGTLDLRIPHDNGSEGILCVDTGFDGGVSLPEPNWSKWRESHRHSATTLKTAFELAEGWQIHIETWAESISFGPLVLTDVPITDEGPEKAKRWGRNYEGTIGVAALKRVDFIVDGRNQVVYFLAKKNPAPPYTHNRLGAIFVATATHTNQAVARVATGSPAFEAGVRDGDVLLDVDGIACTSSQNWLSRFNGRAGTKLKLTLERDRKTFTTTATLRDILHASADKQR
jgi:PDZ domain/Aspartyl protease